MFNRLLLALLLLPTIACFDPDLGNGDVPCGSDNQCPEGYECRADDLCYREGSVGGDNDAAQADARSELDASTPDAGDQVAPETTLDSVPPVLTQETTAEFTFSSSEAGSTFECKVDTAAFTACASPLNVSPGDGAHTFEVRATDASGNVDATPAAHTWTIDSTAPETTIDSAPTGTILVSDATFVFSASEVSTFECSLNGGAFAACTSPTQLTNLGDGQNDFAVRATDAIGNVDATPATAAFTVDTGGPPDTTITAAPAAQSNSITAIFIFTATEAGSTFECALDGGAFAACSSPFSVASLTQGAHTFSVRATDTAGLTDATPANHAWNVDTVPPNTGITSSPVGTVGPSAAIFTFSSSEANSSFECRNESDAFAACTSPHTPIGLADGDHTFAVRAIDLAGNIDPTPATAAWTLDATPPNTKIDTGPTGTVVGQSATFTFSADEAGVSLECRLDGGAFASCTSPTVFSGVTAGSHTFFVRAVDAVGNADATPASSAWTVVVPQPILRFEFDGDAVNTGSLGAPHNGLESNIAYVPGKFGSAVQFQTAADSTVTIPNTRVPLSSNSDYTFGIWFREAAVVNGFIPLFDFRGLGGGWQSYHGASGTAITSCYSDALNTGACNSFNYTPIGVFHHLTFRYDGSSLANNGGAPIEVFLDGKPAVMFSGDNLIPNPDNGNIMNAAQALNFVLGKDSNFEVDRLQIYDRVFDAEQQCEHVLQGTWDGTDCAVP